MHEYRKYKVSVNGRIGRTSRITGNAAAANAYNVADMASLPAGRAPCGREQRGHPRRPAYSSDLPPADLFEISRRRTWPFHIQSPERTSTGTKTNRVAGA